MLRTNLDGFYNVLRPVVLPMVRARRGGRIVTLSSVAGHLGQSRSDQLRGLEGGSDRRHQVARARAGDAADHRELRGPRLDRDGDAGGTRIRAALAGLVPLQRLGTPADVAAAVGFLFSPGAAYITAQVLAVNGGIR